MQFIYDDALFSLSNNTVCSSGSRERVLQTNHKAEVEQMEDQRL